MKTRIVIDVDKVCEAYNANNLDPLAMTRKRLKEDAGISTDDATLSAMKNVGTASPFLARVFRMKEISGLSWNDFMCRIVSVKPEKVKK